MKIFMSYFASKAPQKRKVCIAKKTWRFAPGLPKAPQFAPANPWVSDFANRYRAELDARFPNPEALLAALEEICAKTSEPILCCYEKDSQECHRSILAAYIQEKLGITIEEWQPENSKTEQLKLG